ncbi:MAG: hypothetical protein KKG95_07910 [Candidatus Omnitrophica bacterium]|nr:hypothetical protein [Candidatus Omnitrophota bacterium]
MVLTLLKTKSYSGEYVALESFENHNVIASGANPKEVYKEALSKGCKNPVISYVPVEGMVQIY